MINSLDEAIAHCLKVAEEKEKFENFVCGYCAPGYEDGYFKDTCRLPSNIPAGWSWGECSESNCPLFSECLECAKEHRQLAEWLKELKWYREDTRFADLYERICIKRDDDREYFARTKDKTYITRIAEKEMFIHMMQDMMLDRYGVEEVNADEEGSDSE